MKRTLLKSKIHRAVVTDKNISYEGSITVDPELMKRADLLSFERVDIYDINNGERFSTYVIPGEPGRGEMVVNGAAARKVEAGDLIILASYASYSEKEAARHRPRLVYVNAQNRPVESDNVLHIKHATGAARGV
ncbi:MAG: aspartate 1-decarboxylase [Nitrospirae bacterium]|nr:aspartate 1-decarboxylase [Nitrospirota bacterium]